MTAVQWLAEQLEEKGKVSERTKSRILEFKIDVSDYLDLKRQAKEMEKDQICWAYLDGQHKDKKEIPSKYYHETYFAETYGSKGSGMSEKPNDQTEISDEEIFKQSIKEMEEWYGSDCKEEIDAHFRGAKWMQKWYTEQLKSNGNENKSNSSI